MPTRRLRLAPHERRELKKMAASRTMKAGEVRRAKVILQLAAGQSYRTISEQHGCGQDFVARWKARFVKERLAGLYARHRGKIVSEKIIGQEARILKATKEAPADGSTHWSTRRLAGHLGVSHSRVARVWARAGIQPHRLRRYMASTDPEFEEKAADVIGLYLKPPLNAAVFCVDEKSAIQALDRLDPPSCRSRPVGRNGTALNIIAMERSRSTQPLIPGAGRSSARPAPDTPVQSSSPFWKISS